MKGFLAEHIALGPITIFGRNAMHWGITIKSKRYGYICFRLPFLCFGRWWRLYFYVSPNATPWAATFMIGRKHSREDWALSRLRLYEFGHNFDVNDDVLYSRLRVVNDMGYLSGDIEEVVK